MHPCLYIKQEKDFKNEEVKQRAWKEIAKELDLENGKLIEQLRNNFTKLVSKRRTKLFIFFLTPSIHRRRIKANDARSSEQRLHLISLFSRKNFFF